MSRGTTSFLPKVQNSRFAHYNVLPTGLLLREKRGMRARNLSSLAWRNIKLTPLQERTMPHRLLVRTLLCLVDGDASCNNCPRGRAGQYRTFGTKLQPTRLLTTGRLHAMDGLRSAANRVQSLRCFQRARGFVTLRVPI